MRYREPERRSRRDLEADLGASSSDVVAAALMDCASFEPAEWAVDRILDASRDTRIDVVRAALAAIGVLARRLALPTDRRIWATLLRGLDDAELAGIAEDVVDDLELYGTTGRRGPDARFESDG